MNFDTAIEYIHNTLKFGSKLGLHNITSLLCRMGNPHMDLKFIHVAGTNGKGSTTAFISSILQAAGYRTGIFTSPYLVRFTERIRIGDEEISHEALGRITAFVKEKVDEMVSDGENHPTEFEIVTAIGFQFFKERACDIVVLEVGLGGRYDSTNVVEKPEVAAITTISYDHMDILGETLPKIAYEKAGIIKCGGDVVLYPQDEDVNTVIQEVCREKGAPLWRLDLKQLIPGNYGIDGQAFDYGELKNLRIGLLGDHQICNAAMAVEVIRVLQGRGFVLSEEALRRGLASAKWPGRFEVVHQKPLFIIDGAHNDQGAGVLVHGLKKYFPGKKIHFIFGALRDKEISKILKKIQPLAHTIITVTTNNTKAMNSGELLKYVNGYCHHTIASDTIREAIGQSLSIAGEDDVICAFGSLYYIGEIREYFMN